ncbi:MAG: hypothetical protein ACOX3K_05725 [Bacilli bacterium]|jgi:hypothetical protein
MNKKTTLLFGALSLLVACSPKTTYKTPSGINSLWADEVGYFSRAATVFEEDGTRYYIFERNQVKNDETVTFALKTATLQEGEVVYSKPEIILEPSNNGWDRYIFSPSVVKGEFHKGDKTYRYLLAYGGRKTENDLANQVGIAYSEKITGPWIKHETPLITYDPDVYGDEYGAGAPSLVSYDKKGKVRLFYAYAETNLTNERIVDCDFSNLNDIKIDQGKRHISVHGLRDNADNVILANADFAIDPSGNLYCVRDVFPLSGNAPGFATSIQVAVADVGILNDFISYEWEVLSTYTTSMTVDYEDDDSLGWDEIYSAALVTDPYGHLAANQEKLIVIYSTADEPEEREDTSYKWSAFLAYMEVNIAHG